MEALIGTAKIAAANIALRAGVIGTASAGGSKAINTFKLMGYDAVRNTAVRVVYSAERAREALAAAAKSVGGSTGGPPKP